MHSCILYYANYNVPSFLCDARLRQNDAAILPAHKKGMLL